MKKPVHLFVRFRLSLFAVLTAVAAAAREWPDAGGEHQYARLDWDLIERDMKGWSRLPPLTTKESVNEASCVLPGDKDPLDVLERRTRALIADLSSSGVDLAAETRELDELMARATASRRSWRETRFPVFSAVHALNRRISLRNPLLKGITRLVFVGHEAMPFDEFNGGWHMCDQYFGFHATLHGASVGDGLYVLENPFSAHPVARSVLDGRVVEEGPWKGRELGHGGYLSPDVSWDGSTIAFAYTRGKPQIRKWNDDTVYHIFTCAADGSSLRQITTGCSNDIDPCWLPNGRLAFISERRGGFGRCHGRPVPTFTLHSMFPDGSDIVQLSPHETNEWHPSVDNDGMILYTRWDYVDRGFSQAHHLWRTTPDGRDPREVNGNTRERLFDSSPLMEMNGRAVPGSRLYVAVATPHHGCAYGSIILVDPAKRDDNRMSQVRRVTPEQPLPESETHGGGMRASGAYATPWPLSEKYFLCVYDGHANGQYQPHSIRRYAITLVDVFGNKTRIYTHPTISCLDPMPLQARPRPPVLAHGTLVGRPAGADGTRPVPVPAKDLPKTAHIGLVNVYNSRLPFPAGTEVAALRVWQVLPKFSPLTGRPRLGAESQQVARQCLGTVPVEKDGSAFFEAPVDVPLYFQALDAEGCTVQNMRSDTYVHPGERLMCNGCHEERTSAASKPGADLPLAMRRAASRIRPAPEGAKPYSYVRLVQPVLNAKCVSCHGEKRAPKAPDLRNGDWRRNRHGWSTSFNALRPYVHFFAYDYEITRRRHGYQAFIEPAYTAPRTSGAHASKLYAMLKKGHHRVKLTPEEWERLLVFMGSNAQFAGHDHDIDAQRDGKVVPPPYE
jgi:hypothetical protein